MAVVILQVVIKNDHLKVKKKLSMVCNMKIDQSRIMYLKN